MQTPQENLTKKLRRRSVLGPCAYIFTGADTGSWRLERPQADVSLCISCGICKSCCPADAVTVQKEAPERVTFLLAYCKGCGICANECPKKCIAMVPERGGDNYV